jgi:hypothetical protein
MPDSGGGYFDQELLHRFRPQLVYDRQYDYRATAAETMVENPGNLLRGFDDALVAGNIDAASGTPPLSLGLLSQYPAGRVPHSGDCICAAATRKVDARRMELEHGPCVYGRVVEAEGSTWLQYWLWLYDNPKNVRGIGRHKGAWEFVQLALDSSGTPTRLTYSQHTRGEARNVDDDAEFVSDDGGWHPVVYVAPLSHACYFEARTHVYLGGMDHPYGDGQALMPPVRPFGGWADWPGRWGNTEWAVIGEGKGPRSPGHQKQRWSRPADFHGDASSWLRRRLGWLVHQMGKLTFPRPPLIEVGIAAEGVRVEYALFDPVPHIYITLHTGQDIVRSRIVDWAPRHGVEIFPMDTVPADCVVCASAFNWMRQRSNLVACPVG